MSKYTNNSWQYRSDIVEWFITLYGANLMAVSYYNQTKNRYRITLEIDVEDDFNPRQIDWHKVLDMHDNENVESYTEDLSNTVSLL